MTDWTFFVPGDLSTTDGLIGYAVHDALSARLGAVTGWVLDPAGDVALLMVACDDAVYLVPLGLLDHIDDGVRQVTLRRLTGHALRHECLCFDPALPPPATLEALLARHPDPRPMILERLTHPDCVSLPRRRGHLTMLLARGDGPCLLPPPDWHKLTRYVRPPWQPLDRLGNDNAA